MSLDPSSAASLTADDVLEDVSATSCVSGGSFQTTLQTTAAAESQDRGAS